MIRDFDALVAFLDDRTRTPFAWGRQDCVTFAADALEAMTGRAPLAGVASRHWRTARGAARALVARGGLEAATDAVLRPIAPAHAHRGDVGLLEVEGRLSLVVFEGDLVVGPGEAGLVRQARGVVRKAWSAT